jgi:hypothetical protein
LPDPIKVPYDEGFVTIKAECEGPVEWLVLLTPADPKSKPKLKYKTGTDPKSLDVSVPPEACTISVFCVGVIESKPTRFARTDIIVEAGNGPRPPPVDPDEKPIPADVPFIVTVVYDPLNVSNDYTILTKWPDASKQLVAAGHKPYLKSIKDPNIKAWLDAAGKKKPEFAAAIKQAGIPLVIVQDKNGKAVAAIPCPKTVAELLTALRGGK